jgi:hypothetical protein
VVVVKPRYHRERVVVVRQHRRHRGW